jgi:hypothetical protein
LLEGRAVIITLGCGILSLIVARKRAQSQWIRYGVAIATMLLAALAETWIVTFWQPDVGRLDLEWQRTIAKLFAFPLTVRVGQASWYELKVVLVLIDLGGLRILGLESPPFLGVQGYITWSVRLRGAAFLLVLGFYLAAIAALVAGGVLVRTASRRWHRKTLMPAVEDTSIAKNVNRITAEQTERASGTRVLWRLTALCNCNRLVGLGESLH